METIFAEMKGPRGLSRASLRRNWKVHIQATLAMTAHNLMQMAKATGRRRNTARVLAQVVAPNPLSTPSQA